MNKKFTMVCASLLLASAFSVNAQIGEPTFDNPTSHRAKALTGKALVNKLSLGQNESLVQISVDDNADGQASNLVLSMNDNGSVSVVDIEKINLSDSKALARTLWCVTVSAENQGQNPKYDFLNKATGMYLDLSMANGYNENPKNVICGGEIGGWAFSFKFAESLEESKPMYSYYESDKVVGLYLDDVAGKAGNVLKAKTSDASKVADAGFAKFSLRYANQYVLNAAQLNTILGTQDAKEGLQLKFNPDIKGTTLTNPFNNAKFVATDAEKDYLYVSDLKNESYLKVDTAYTNESGVKFHAYGWTKGKPNGILLDQHKFKFIYSPSDDKLYIYAKEVREKDENAKYWTNAKVNKDGDWRVSLQDLIKDEVRILTVDYDKQNTEINLGFGGCTAATITKSSVADDVYYIQNEKGQYLASVIHENGEVSSKFVTVNDEEQDVAHMPAYQWVVLKKNTQNDQVKATSPVKIVNREFANALNTDEIQLYKNEGAVNFYLKSDKLFSKVEADSLSFVAVPAASKEDAYLGYKKLTKEELKVNKYTFNYWHPYADDKFIAAQNDSILTVKEGKSAFVVDTIAKSEVANAVNIPYGYTVTTDVAKRIKGLKQLQRTAYKVSLNGNTIAINNANQFNVGSSADGTKNKDVVEYVFFKENNHINGKHYYAIVEAYKNRGTLVIEGSAKTIKAGVSDYDVDATLKSQLLNETRTSAFAIAPDNTPLYRRFNSMELEGNEGDTQDVLRFYEKYRNEYLQMESNPNFIVNKDVKYLGIDAEGQAEGGLSFLVDTAWVNRGAGNIKPQYLISIDRNDFAGVPGEPCTEDDHHVDANGNPTDAAHCVHAKPAIPAFQRGWYLVNFDYKGANITDDYKWKNYTRAGFVEAINYNDTLYILRDEFKNVANDKIDFAAIKDAEKAAANKAGYVNHIHSLTGDQHKYVTWSMRFLNPEKAANEVEEDRSFLFESMARQNEPAIAPEYAAWLKMQNGCLVLSDYNSNFNDVQTGGDDALIFNVKKGNKDDIATENETIATTEVAVIANNGSVVVKNAAGKNVVVSTILGQVVANEVLTSDNATINVPAGIVVVAVEGESFKVNVK